MIPNYIARLLHGEAMTMLRQSLLRSEQDAVEYIAHLHDTGPGLYTAPTHRRPDRHAEKADHFDVCGATAATGGHKA